VRILPGLVALAIAGSLLTLGSQQSSIHPPAITTPPDANSQMQMRETQSKRQNFDSVNTERKRQLADDALKLLKVATERKDEVDRTGGETLSVDEIRKAELIEKLANGVKEKMKLTVGAS
jgi:hypothetical protein